MMEWIGILIHPPKVRLAERIVEGASGAGRSAGGGRPNEGRDGARRDPGEVPEQASVIEEVRPQALGHGEHHLAVRHRSEQGLLQPDTPHRQALGVAAGTPVAALAGEGEQVLVPAAATAHLGEPVLQDAAGQELLDHLGDDAPPGPQRGANRSS